MTWRRDGGKSLGWGDVNLNLISGFKAATVSKRVENETPPILGLYMVRKPSLMSETNADVACDDVASDDVARDDVACDESSSEVVQS